MQTTKSLDQKSQKYEQHNSITSTATNCIVDERTFRDSMRHSTNVFLLLLS